MLSKKYTYQDAVNILTSSDIFRVSPGLERIGKCLDLLNYPQNNLKIIHVAGTNGKGSVCSTLAAILKNAGYKTGLYTSPHIFKYTERIKINDIPISDEEFCKYVFEIINIADKNGINLTEFEILTAVMFKYFSDKNVDIAVIETGLGGRFDATNIINKNICSVITHIDFDHTERLGDTIEKIASEKAGIIKPNCPCIVCQNLPIFTETANKINSKIIIADNSVYKNYQEYFTLKGEHQNENLSVALTVIKNFFKQINEPAIIKGLKEVKHPCRFQYFEDKNLIIDGAHNPNGIEHLVKSLNNLYPNKKRRYIFGCLNNKDYPQMLSTLSTKNNAPVEIYLYHFKHNNSAEIKQLKQACPTETKVLNSKNDINFNDDYLNIICGSFYMLAELTEKLGIKIN